MSAPVDNTNRFTGRADAYEKHRQGYPPEAVAKIVEHLSLKSEAVVLDLGSGTGNLSKQFLETLPDVQVIGLEPNEDMRIKQESLLSSYITSNRFRSVNGSAEKTGLVENSTDVAVAAAAFHWFDGPLTAKEIKRVVRPTSRGHPVAIITGSTVPPENVDPHWRSLRERIEVFREETGTNHTHKVHEVTTSPGALQLFFSEGKWEEWRFEGGRELTLQDLLVGMNSYSTMPQVGTREHEVVIEKMKALFAEFERDGKIFVANDYLLMIGFVA